MNILLIDDNQDQMVITQRILTKIDPSWHLDWASNAKEGLDKIKKSQYSAILCDYRLPDLSGIEVLKLLRQEGNECPFIIVTSMGSERLAAEAIKLGAYDYVVKDASYEVLLPEIIQQSIERHQEKIKILRLEKERNAAMEALQQEKASLESINKIMMDREDRIMELKKKVNALLKEMGKPPEYD